MIQLRHLRVVLGAAVWIGAFCLIWSKRDAIVSSDSYRTIGELKQFWTEPRPTAQLQLPTDVYIEVGDPIFVRDSSGELRQVGEVQSLLLGQDIAPTRRARASSVQIFLFPNAPECGSDSEFTYVTQANSLASVVATLLTPDRQALVTEEIRNAYEQYRVEIGARLQPVLEGTLRDGWSVIEQDLPAAIERHAPELQALGAKYEQEIVNCELLPLAKQEIWPIVQQRSQPVLESVGMELWERVSFWRFGWRAAYDRSPLPDRHLLQHEWQRFVRQEAMPILSQHTGDMIDIVRGVIQDASRNEVVQAGVRRNLARVAADPEFQQLVYDIFEEVFILNPKLSEILQQRWSGPEAQQALQLASERLEPTLQRISDILFGSFERGITPEFAHVLRAKILAKDQRWFLLETGPGSVQPQRQGTPVFTAKIASEPATQPFTVPRLPIPAGSIRPGKESGGGS
jgi:hypothetical protein